MKTTYRVLLSLLVAALLVAGLMTWGGVSLDSLADAWSRVSWSSIALAFAIYAAQYVLRAERFRWLVPPDLRPSRGCMLSVTSAYGMATLILPAKVGEASFVVYLNRAGGVPTSESIAALVVARLLDFASLFLGFGAACLVVEFTHAAPGVHWFGSLGALLVIAAIAVFALSARGDLIVALAARLSRVAGLARSERGARLIARVETMGAALRSAAADGRVWRAAVLSLPMWACVFAFCAVLGRGFGLPDTLGFAQAAFGASLAILTSLVPLSAFANFGTLETGWVLGFGVFGVSRELALATGTGLHLVQLACAILLGVAGHIGMGLVGRKR